MATFTSVSSTGVDSDTLFPALHGGGFTVIAAEVDRFSIRYDSDGLIVHFISDNNDLQYNGVTPIAGTFDQIHLAVNNGVSVTLATLTNLAQTSITSFNSPTLADTLLAGDDTLIGNSGNDTLRGHGGTDTYIGNAGDDVFVFDQGSNDLIVHGSGGNGFGGEDETDTIKVLGDFSANTFTHIDAIVFAGSDDATGTFKVQGGALGLSSTLDVTGDAHTNVIDFVPTGNSGVALDISGWTFSDWTSGVDKVNLGSSTGPDILTGTIADDLISGGGGDDQFIGNGGNDIFALTAGSNPSAIHGGHADGSGGEGETNLIRPSDQPHDLRNTTITNIDGFQFSVADAVIIFDKATGAITDRIGGVVTLDAGQLGTGFAKGLQVYADPAGRSAAFEITGGSADVSKWKLISASAKSIVHATGTDGNDTLKGWSGTDVQVLGDGNDRAFGFSGKDWLYGGAGNDKLTGGKHKDMLTGGEGADKFDFNHQKETRKGGGKRDEITDFDKKLDRIDLKTIDADKKHKGNQKFDFIGKHKFNHEPGELHYKKKGGFVLVEGDVNGNGKADFQIEVHGVHKLFDYDFLL